MQGVKESASVVLRHKDQVLLVKRRDNLGAFPGYDAFPGGKVEKGDDSQFSDYSKFQEFGIAPHILGCAFREIKEELGINLEDHLEIIIGISELPVFTTPPFNPIRFKNHTILIELKKVVPFKIDKGEISQANWFTFNDLKSQFSKGHLLMVPPVRAIIECEGEPLLIRKKYEDLEDQYRRGLFEIEPIKEFFQTPIPSNTIPPATNTNCFRFDDLIIDPSPKDEVVLESTIKFFKSKGVKRILITHHHGDHHQFLDKVRDGLNARLSMSEFTFLKLKERYNLKPEEVQILKEGSVVGKWLGENLIVIEVPGHDEGQIALAPESFSFIIVGDLIQGVGTVVIPDEEGDMQKYFASLERCIELCPRYIIPSHGIMFGGTFYLEKTLEHRKIREKQIIELIQQGKSPNDMLPIIYKGVDKRLYPLALQNIKAHLKKIYAESLV